MEMDFVCPQNFPRSFFVYFHAKKEILKQKSVMLADRKETTPAHG